MELFCLFMLPGLVKLVNKNNQQKCSLIFDEFPTIYFNDIDSSIATATSNRVATCLGMQDFSQLKKDYGAEQAAVIMNIVGNIISGQVMGETATVLSERFGKMAQMKESISSQIFSALELIIIDLSVFKFRSFFIFNLFK